MPPELWPCLVDNSTDRHPQLLEPDRSTSLRVSIVRPQSHRQLHRAKRFLVPALVTTVSLPNRRPERLIARSLTLPRLSGSLLHVL